MLRSVVVMFCALVLPLDAVADIEKFMVPSQNGLRATWWPRVSPASGWHHERNASLANGINIVVADGANFTSAETVIYAKANYKPRDRDITSLQALIDRDQAGFRKTTPDIQITEAAPAPIADGTPLRTFTFLPVSKGNWERIAYGDDGDYYVVFVVSSRTRQGLDGANAAFESMVQSYTREPPAPVSVPGAAPAATSVAPPAQPTDRAEPRKNKGRPR